MTSFKSSNAIVLVSLVMICTFPSSTAWTNSRIIGKPLHQNSICYNPDTSFLMTTRDCSFFEDEKVSPRKKFFRSLARKSKRNLAILSTAFALWRGPNVSAVHASPEAVVAATEKVESTTDEENAEETITEEETTSETKKSASPAKRVVKIAAGGAVGVTFAHFTREKKNSTVTEENEDSVFDIPERQPLPVIDAVVENQGGVVQDVKIVDPFGVAQNTNLPLMDRKYVNARSPHKSEREKARIAQKYAAIESLEERAFQILVDLGMVEVTAP